MIIGVYRLGKKIRVAENAATLIEELGEKPLGDGVVSIGTSHVARRIFLGEVGHIRGVNGECPKILKPGHPLFRKAREKLDIVDRDPSRIIYWEKPTVVFWTMFPSMESPLLWAKGVVTDLTWEEEECEK